MHDDRPVSSALSVIDELGQRMIVIGGLRRDHNTERTISLAHRSRKFVEQLAVLGLRQFVICPEARRQTMPASSIGRQRLILRTQAVALSHLDHPEGQRCMFTASANSGTVRMIASISSKISPACWRSIAAE